MMCVWYGFHIYLVTNVQTWIFHGLISQLLKLCTQLRWSTMSSYRSLQIKHMMFWHCSPDLISYFQWSNHQKVHFTSSMRYSVLSYFQLSVFDKANHGNWQLMWCNSYTIANNFINFPNETWWVKRETVS